MTMKIPSRLRARLILIALSAAITLAGLAASAANGAIYQVDACQRPDNLTVGVDRWTPAISGAYVYYGNNCAAGGGLDVSFDPHREHTYGERASWTFTAPAGTTLATVSAYRESQVPPDRVNGSAMAIIRTDSQILEACARPYACNGLTGEISFGLSSASTLSAVIECGGAPGGACPAGASSIALRRIRLALNDTSAPALTRAPSGTLTSGTDTSRSRSLSYTATDVGGGLFRQRIFVDGVRMLDQPVDPSAAACAMHSLGGFVDAAPCPVSSGGAATLDMSGLGDGPHRIRLEVTDVTDVNKATEGPWTILVDNAPPTVGDVDVRGNPREGESLTCSATISGQTATTAYQWVRAAADGSSAKPVAGATGASYALTAQDVGRKVLCQVTGTDGGGSAEKSSTLTTGPFANGAVVSRRSDTASATTAAAAAAAVPRCRTSSLALFGTASSIRRSYNRSRVRLSGRLVGNAGKPSVGKVLQIVQIVVRSGSVKRKRIGSVRTKTGGRFKTSAPPGPSRAIQLIEEGCGSVGRVITERVRGALRAKTTTRRVRNKQTARIRGRVLGGYVGRGVPVELQVKVGRKWRDVKHAMTNSRGQYKVGYRFSRTYVRYTYSFRVVTRAGGAWPYMPAKSRTVKVRVN